MSGQASKLLALAEQVQQATGPDRELDFAIARALDRFDPKSEYAVAFFTASLDAAMTLAANAHWGAGTRDATGKAWAWCAYDYEAVAEGMEIANAATPALALAAAALRALAQPEQSS